MSGHEWAWRGSSLLETTSRRWREGSEQWEPRCARTHGTRRASRRTLEKLAMKLLLLVGLGAQRLWVILGDLAFETILLKDLEKTTNPNPRFREFMILWRFLGTRETEFVVLCFFCFFLCCWGEEAENGSHNFQSWSCKACCHLTFNETDSLVVCFIIWHFESKRWKKDWTGLYCVKRKKYAGITSFYAIFPHKLG